ncbi:MAG TPA: lipase maturation factor family protein [Pirellulales bacterium]|jgi:predicted DCC family thiol-disulfide oxidoreductase YuxK|nr:lipase maturation factor family protein [Pirellulales bacterium]
MSDLSNTPSADLPLLVFDGECRFCRATIERWREALGSQMRFAPYQEVGVRFPQIGEKAFRQAVHFVDAQGATSRGAEAVFRVMAYFGRKRWLLWMYTRLPLFAFLAESIYRLVAANRTPLSTIRRVWWGKDLQQPTYHISSALFLRLLGVVYLIAFVSLWVQIDGLIGDHGISPLANYQDALVQLFAQQSPPLMPAWNVPTLTWLNPHNGFLHVLCGAGTVLSLMLIAGVLPLPTLILLWVDYLSLFHAGQEFLSFQWDILLLETGFAAIFLAPFVVRSKFLADRHPPRLAIWLIGWILFRLMLESGAVKLTWSELSPIPVPNTWKSLTALNSHYWTQPLPMWTSWYMAKMPQWFQKLSVVFVLAVELGTPWLMCGPRMLRAIACGAITLLMLLIAATGNYNFFNLLTVVLALLLLDDKMWPRFLRQRIRGTDWPLLASHTRWRTVLLIPFAVFALLAGSGQVREALFPTYDAGTPLASQMHLTQFCLVNPTVCFGK